MAKIKSMFEISPEKVTAVMRNFAPFEKERTFRFKWGEWFWMGDSVNSDIRLMIGPFKTRRRAQEAWDRVPEHEPGRYGQDYFREQGRREAENLGRFLGQAREVEKTFWLKIWDKFRRK